MSLIDALAAQLGTTPLETHLSWVLLAGNDAYKIKKPVRFAFVDYGTLERRKFFCEEEVRLNRRLAPDLYLDATPITGSTDKPQLDGSGPALEYAVHMRRLPEGALFSEMLAAGTLRPDHIDALAALLANFHANAPLASAGDGFGDVESRKARAMAALAGASASMTPQESTALQQWMETESAALAPLWSRRLATGRIRECHGDLHLANLVCTENGVAAFDGIEFDPALRWIDTLDDISFAVMDFAARDRRDFAFRLLNGWLDHTGDHEAIAALRFSVVYRALVRSQVEQLSNAPERARRYADTAMAWSHAARPELIIMHGLPGSGKTFVSQQLLQARGAIRLRSDVERKRMFGLGMLENSRDAGKQIYGTEATTQTYQRLFELAQGLLQSGYPVVLDAAFLRRDERAQALALAREMKVPFSIASCEAPAEVLRERLQSRRGDASEADVNVLERLTDAAEPLDASELAWVLPV